MAITVILNNPEFHDLLDLKANIVFSTETGEELALQLLKPQWKSAGKGFPLVVFIQGSAWQKPNQFWELPQLALLVKRGFVVASVTHRSCWQQPAPAFLQDVKAALRFLRKNAAEYDIDPDRVCAWGTSSGGNTALLLGLTGDDPAFETEEHAGFSTRVNCVVDCFGPTDLNKMIDVQFKAPHTKENLLFTLGGGKEETYQQVLDLISPIKYAEPGRDLPPFLILHGDADPVVLFEDSEAFYNKLIEGGYQADLVRVTDAPHEGNFWSMQLLTIIFDFIEKQIG
ncbi:MAG: alpha/beta hydrolase [Clostridia bacterium]|nr:alpha/beta hydrolase [Clostridia bacterium]